MSAELGKHSRQIARFARILAIVATGLAVFPSLVAWLSTPPGSAYLGSQLNFDDHMVYAAWMHQAMEGRWVFDNRFTTDVQPGLTVHLYFLVVGWLAKLVGIPLASTLARLTLTYVFVRLLGRLLSETGTSVFASKFALVIACFGGGLGFLYWERFGEAAIHAPGALAALSGGRAPIDVWQPEAFVFPSMLTNGLFMAALCLILVVLRACWRAQESWSAVPMGAIAFGVLANIHSYDAALVGLVLVGWAVAQASHRRLPAVWLSRVAVIVSGALPSALWLGYVLSQDPVFRARAATPTFSPTFIQVVLGLLPAIGLAVVGLMRTADRRAKAGGILLIVTGIAVWTLSAKQGADVFLFGWPAWVAYFAASVGAVVLASKRDDSAHNLWWAWGVIGVCSLYLPVLFQRKLAMGLVVPWGVLGALGLAAIIESKERSSRNMVAALGLVATCATSLLWFQREASFIRDDVTRTAMHSVYYSQDAQRVLKLIEGVAGRKVVIAMPGVWNEVSPGVFGQPIVPDLNPVIVGITGAYTYAGHWSETPDYARRRARLMSVFLAGTPPERRSDLLREMSPDYIVQPNPSAFPAVPQGGSSSEVADLRSFGEIVYEGHQLWLIKVRRP